MPADEAASQASPAAVGTQAASDSLESLQARIDFVSTEMDKLEDIIDALRADRNRGFKVEYDSINSNDGSWARFRKVLQCSTTI